MLRVFSAISLFVLQIPSLGSVSTSYGGVALFVGGVFFFGELSLLWRTLSSAGKFSLQRNSFISPFLTSFVLGAACILPGTHHISVLEHQNLSSGKTIFFSCF